MKNFISFFLSVRCLLHTYVYGGGGGRGNKVANKISAFSSQSDQLNFLPDFPPVFPEPCGGGGRGGRGGGGVRLKMEKILWDRGVASCWIVKPFLHITPEAEFLEVIGTKVQ